MDNPAVFVGGGVVCSNSTETKAKIIGDGRANATNMY